MNKPFFYDQNTSQCPEAKGCDYAKLQFCTLGNGELHKQCAAFKGNIDKTLTPQDNKPLTATIKELTNVDV